MKNLYMIGNERHDNYMDSHVIVSTDEEMQEWLDDEEYSYGSPYFYSVHGPVHPDSHLDIGRTKIHEDYIAPTLGDAFKIAFGGMS